jgi:hypothetical protein
VPNAVANETLEQRLVEIERRLASLEATRDAEHERKLSNE